MFYNLKNLIIIKGGIFGRSNILVFNNGGVSNGNIQKLLKNY